MCGASPCTHARTHTSASANSSASAPQTEHARHTNNGALKKGVSQGGQKGFFFKKKGAQKKGALKTAPDHRGSRPPIAHTLLLAAPHRGGLQADSSCVPRVLWCQGRAWHPSSPPILHTLQRDQPLLLNSRRPQRQSYFQRYSCFPNFSHHAVQRDLLLLLNAVSAQPRKCARRHAQRARAEDRGRESHAVFLALLFLRSPLSTPLSPPSSSLLPDKPASSTATMTEVRSC